jgi:hypothetical protein
VLILSWLYFEMFLKKKGGGNDNVTNRVLRMA